MMTPRALPLLVALATSLVGCDVLAPEPGEELPGGATTNITVGGSRAYSEPLANLDPAHRASFFAGNSFFTQSWVTAPASTMTRDGLGPTFNASACAGCHVRDGRGRPPETREEPMLSMLVRLSVPGEDADGGPLPEPTYGGQFQPFAVLGVASEGSVVLEYDDVPGTYGDGEAYVLRRPRVVFDTLSYGPMASDVMTSARVAPGMAGLGLLEIVPEADILSREDPEDADGDGISGRANWVWDMEQGALALGRFGWKAGQPSLLLQTAGAFNGDIGITTMFFPDQNCPAPQVDCASALTGGEPEAPEDILGHVVRYARALAIPVRLNVSDAQVLAGRELFRDAGCTGCHTERMTSGVSTELPELSRQPIRPFTDLLLHDMGEGLADGRPEFEASGNEWRTPPLWGVGRIDDVNDHTYLLHDGRARGFAEAILWHGGEAAAARERFRTMPRADRDALIRFLESL